MFLVQGTRMGYKTMRRLVAFGCSFTYGVGLEARSEAWPIQVGKSLGYKVENIGIPGASNLEILTNILRFKFNSTDVIVIMWTVPYRELVFTKKWWEQVGLWSKGEHARRFLKQEELDFTMKSWIYMQHADLYLKSQKVKYIHYPAAPEQLLEHKPDFIYISNLFLTRTKKIDEASDKKHPGPKSHKKQATEIVRILNDII